jgi:hypothetical protein
MGPLATAAIIGGGSFLGNLLGGRQQKGLQEDDLQRILQLFSPGAISGDTSALFSAFRQSPMYSALQTRAMTGASALGGQLQTSFARRGLSNSGIAGAALPIARSSFSRNFQDIDADLWSKALQSIMAGRGAQANALSGYRSFSPGGQAFGKSLEILGPYLRSLMSSQGEPFDISSLFAGG